MRRAVLSQEESVGAKMLAWKKLPVISWMPMNVCGWLWSTWLKQAKSAKGVHRDKEGRVNYRDLEITMLQDLDALPRAAAFVVKYRITGRMMKRFDLKM